MIQTLFSITSALMATISPMNPYLVIEDLSELPILSPDLKERQTLKMSLANGLEVLLISDEKIDQSAAAIRVDVGSWSDPQKFPGMAHFCEHMLFMGTEKYPSENAFSTLVSDYAGQMNAFTAPDRTVYSFSSQTSGFLELLDHFAHFFIDPLFNPENIAREMHAVDQEHAKNLESDAWREYMIFKETGSQTHPNRSFSTGNSQTLSEIPQEALKKWHRQNYGANKMHLVLYSSLPMKTLKDTIIETFSEIPESLQASIDASGPLSSEDQIGTITFIKPIKNRHSLTLSWELPQELSLDETKSANLVAYTLRRGQEHSLYEKLKEEGLIDTMSVGVDDLGGAEHRFFQVSLELTNRGIEEIDTAVERVFEAIAGLKKNGVPKYLFEEKNQMAKLNYQYQERTSPFQFVTALADNLSEEPLSTYPRNTVLSSDYSPKKIASVLEVLSPKSCLISLMAPPELTKVAPTRKEKWLGGEYEVKKIPEKWLSTWSKVEPNEAIKTPGPNPFIPENLSILKAEGTTPSLIASDEIGTAYYVRSSEFQTPDSIYHIHILSPEIDQSPQASVLVSLYIDHLTDVLSPTLSAAKAAGLNSSFGEDRCAIYFTVSGYSEKASLLLQQIVQAMPRNPPTLEQFSIYVDRHMKAYMNSEKELAVRQAKELADSIINPHKSTNKSKLRALSKITYEEFLEFHQKLFSSTYLEALFAGNLTTKQAESAWLDLIHYLGKSPFKKEDHIQAKVMHLPALKGPYKLLENTTAQGNAALLLVDQGPFSFDKRASQEVLSSVMKEAFFDELRSKQKTGYIAVSEGIEVQERLFSYFVVQSNSHQPDELLFRFEQFIEIYHGSLSEKISEKRFETLKSSLASSLLNRFRNLKVKSALWDMLAFEKGADFSFVEKRINALQDLKYESFLKDADAFLSRKNRKRLAILFEGKLPNPFSYQLTSLHEIGEIVSYEPSEHSKPLLEEEEALSRS